MTARPVIDDQLTLTGSRCPDRCLEGDGATTARLADLTSDADAHRPGVEHDLERLEHVTAGA